MSFLVLFSLFTIVNASELTLFHQWGDSGPSAREHSEVWIHGGSLYLTKGWGFEPFQGVESSELWKLNLGTKEWTLLPTIGDQPTADSRSVGFSDSGSLLVLNGNKAFFGRVNFTELFRLDVKDDVGVWSRISLSGDGARDFILRNPQLSSIVYSKSKDRFYSVCSQADCDIYEIILSDGNRAEVRKHSLEGGPSARIGFAYGFSERQQKLMISGGQSLVGDELAFYSETWVLDLSGEEPRWIQLEHSISGRRNPCFAFDEKRQELIVWGGTSDGQTSVPNLNRVSFDSVQIQEVPDAAESRSSCVGVYDSQFSRVLMGFGNSAGPEGLILFQDFWEF